MKINQYIFLLFYIFSKMPQFIPIESLFKSTFWNIGALSAILELNEYVEPLFFLAGRELTQHRPKKGYCIHPQQSMASKSMPTPSKGVSFITE
mgnify:CR=1 FL=1